MVKSVVVCCSLLAYVSFAGAQPVTSLPGTVQQESRAQSNELDGLDERKSLRAALSAQRELKARQDVGQPVPRQWTSEERLLLRQQLRQQASTKR